MKRFIAWRQAVINRLIHKPWIVAVRNAPAEPTMQSLYFSNGEQGLIYDLSDLPTVFQDPAGTIPGAAGQPVGLILDTSGNGNDMLFTNATQRPLLQTDGTRWWLQPDGVDDFGATANIDFTSTDKMTVWAGVRKLDDTGRAVAELSVDGNSNDGSFYVITGNNAGVNGYTSASRGTAVATVSQIAKADVSGADTAVLTMTHDIAGSLSTIRRNGVAGADGTGYKGTGNFGNYPLYLLSRGGTSIFFNGPVSSLIVRGVLTSDADLIPGEEWTTERLPT